MSDTEKSNDLPTIAEDLVVTKYKMTGEIVNKVLKELIGLCQVGASVRDLCAKGDEKILEECSKTYRKKKDLQKGVAFPTCISVNNTICHFSPLKSDPDVIMADGDMVKVDLGCHLDGFIAVVAHTLVIGASADNPVTGRKADALLAAHLASEAALRLVKPGHETYEVTDTVSKIAESFKCKPVEGMLSHQLEQNRIDGEKTVIQNPTDAQKKEHDKFDFEVHEVYAMDVLISTGEGKGKEKDTKVTVYKKTDETYMLKMKTSREFYSQVCKQVGTMPFNLRNMEDERKARLGVGECVNHRLIEPFQVLTEKEGESVAQFKFTVLLMPNGPNKITGLPFDHAAVKSEHSVTDVEIQTLLKTSTNLKMVNKKKKKEAIQAMDEGAPPALVES
jgi:curved DNA binding protein